MDISGQGGPTVGVCVVRTECLPPERRLTVTITQDITGPDGLPQHPVDVETALGIVAAFLTDSCRDASR